MCGIMTAVQICPIHGLCITVSLLGLILWSTCTAASAARPLRYTLPEFLDTTQNVTVNSGSEAILPCAVQNLGPKSVIWKKVQQAHAITIGTFVFSPDSRYYLKRLRTQPSSPEWNLHIRDVQPKHAGTYECQISAKEDITRLVILNVIDKGHNMKPGIRLAGTRYAEKGTSIKLNCTASAVDYMPEDVDWFKDGQKLRAGRRVFITKIPIRKTNILHSTLEIKRSNMSDAGTYVCRISQFHIASLKVNVLNAETSNVKRGYIRIYGSGEPNGETKGDHTATEGHGNGGTNGRNICQSHMVLQVFSLLGCWLTIFKQHR